MQKILSEEKSERVSVLSGIAQFDVNEWKSEKRVISIKASTPALLRVSTFYYPGWKAAIDGKNTKIMIEKNTGVMLLDIPKGEHTLELRFKDTPLRYYSKVISFISCFIIAFLVMTQKKKIY